MTTAFLVLYNDVTQVPADLLLLKHAGSFFGVDLAVGSTLIHSGRCTEDQLALAPGDYRIVESQGALRAKQVMFLGTPTLSEFGYDEMREFARRAIEILALTGSSVVRLATTIHGAHYGLDAEEALLKLVQGFQEGLAAAQPFAIDEIVFAERDGRRAELLSAALDRALPDTSIAHPTPERPTRAGALTSSTEFQTGTLRSSAAARAEPPPPAPRKKHVFVAMPFSDEFEDVFEYGIYAPVRKCGLICEKTNESAFTGDILHRIQERITTADLVIAEMTGGRPNVYLEVGYAWGKNVPVVLVARQGEQLHFDVSRHRCLYYKNIKQLASELEKLIRGLLDLPPAEVATNRGNSGGI